MKQGPPEPYVYVHELAVSDLFVGMAILNKDCMCPGTIYGIIWKPGNQYDLQIHWNAKVTKHDWQESKHFIVDTMKNKVFADQ